MMDFSGLSVNTVKAIKYQQTTIDDLKAKESKQQLLIENLLKRVESLEKKN